MSRPNRHTAELQAQVQALQAQVTDLLAHKPAPSGTIVPGRSAESDYQALLAEQREAARIRDEMADREYRWRQDNPGMEPPKPLPQIHDPNVFYEPGSSVPRHAFGEKKGQPYFADADNRPVTERQQDYRAAHAAAEKAEETERNAGLPAHLFRDPTGLVRLRQNGKVEVSSLVPQPSQPAAPVLLAPHPEQVYDALMRGAPMPAATDPDAELKQLRSHGGL